MVARKTLFTIKTGLIHDPLFLHCLKEKSLSEIRDVIDQMYDEVSNFIPDSNFEDMIQSDFHGAYWQLYITWAFHNYGPSKLIVAEPEGPDITLENGTIIEVVNATPGEGNNRPKGGWGGNEIEGGGVVEDPDPKIVLRITGAIAYKEKKYQDWISKKIVKPDQPFVIAINAGLTSLNVLQHPGDPPFSYGAKTVYAVGSLFLMMPQNLETLLPEPDKVFTRPDYSPKKIKHNGSEVESDWFLKIDHQEISGLLFSPSHYKITLPNNRMKDLEFLSNGFARNRLPKRMLRGIQNTWVEVNEKGSGFKYFHEDLRKESRG